MDNENKKTWQVFERENITKENNGVLMNFLERKRYKLIMIPQISEGKRTYDIFP